MATEDGFQPDRAPLFLSGQAEEAGPPGIGKGWDLATISSRILKASILAVAATAIGIAILSIGDPATLVANMTDRWVDRPALQPKADPSTPTVQAIAGAPDVPATTTDAPVRDETAAAVEPAGQSLAEAGQSQADDGQPVTEELFRQFQSWAAAEEARAQADVAQPVQGAPDRVAQDAPAQVRPVKKQRRARSVQNARAEVRPQRHHRARVREEQELREQAPPVADPRAQDPSVQNAQTPSFLQSLGLRN
jgi:hypothetical protein